MDFQSAKISKSAVPYLLKLVYPHSTQLREQAEPLQQLNQAFISGLLHSPSAQMSGKPGLNVHEKRLTNIILEKERVRESMSVGLSTSLSLVEARVYT